VLRLLSGALVLLCLQNASLAYAVDEKDLSKAKKHLDKVHIDKAKETIHGGVHLGPGDKADFPAQEVGARSAQAAAHEAAVSQLSSHRSVGAAGATARGGNALVEQGHSGEVSVQSSVVMDTTQETNLQAPAQIQQLLARLSSTTTQVDEYARRQSEAISKEANERIQRIIAETQAEQDLLLRDASARSLEIEGEYAAKLKAFLQGLDASKAGNLAALEKDLNFRQEQLLSSARDEMDQIHQAATAAKIAAMNQASASVQSDVDQLTEQVKHLGEAEVERRMNSTTTTVITTETHTESHLSGSPEMVKGVAAPPTNADLRAGAVGGEPRANAQRL
jgi:hypothetical protein